jgi:hypothetical protein
LGCFGGLKLKKIRAVRDERDSSDERDNSDERNEREVCISSSLLPLTLSTIVRDLAFVTLVT